MWGGIGHFPKGITRLAKSRTWFDSRHLRQTVFHHSSPEPLHAREGHWGRIQVGETYVNGAQFYPTSRRTAGALHAPLRVCFRGRVVERYFLAWQNLSRRVQSTIDSETTVGITAMVDVLKRKAGINPNIGTDTYPIWKGNFREDLRTSSQATYRLIGSKQPIGVEPIFR